MIYSIGVQMMRNLALL